MALLGFRQTPLSDMSIHELPLIEPVPILDTWIDDIADPVEIIGQGACFRTTFFTLTKLDGVWMRVVVFKAVRPCAYNSGKLPGMLQRAQKAVGLYH